MRIRAAEESDLAAITDLYNALLATTTYEWTEVPHTVAERRAWLSAKVVRGHPILVAVEDGAVVGTGTYGDFRDALRWPGYRFTVEHTVHVAEPYWGRGLGRALVEELVRLAGAAGKRTMVAAIDGTNAGSIRMHARLGFLEVGRLPGIGDKHGKRLDLVLMQRDL
ncbi:MAG: GCN5-related N-acetyltransferase [Actinomycetia bacterium]|nr:GCN5-related N-acetyltransferase [Actinomycetes bacterium]